MNSDAPYRLSRTVQTRWASFENPDAAVGAGGQANGGRKGAPSGRLPAGQTLVLAHGEGPGMVRRIWMTINPRRPQQLRGVVLRAYWDGADKPAVDAPLGDFFGHPLGRLASFESAYVDSPEGRSFCCRFPMPFRRGFRITLSNEGSEDVRALFYEVDFTLGDAIDDEAGYFHAYWSRQNPTTLQEDFAILPAVQGRGRFLGCWIGASADKARYGDMWWGEGEVKIYLDGDERFPTLCGTGTEDYVSTGWGLRQFSQLWQGCPVADHEQMQFAFYRFHGPDPVYFQREARVTIQQIGVSQAGIIAEQMAKLGLTEWPRTGSPPPMVSLAEMQAMDPQTWMLFERQDDWCATAYFYLDRPSSDLPAIQPYADRVAGLPEGGRARPTGPGE